MDKKGLMYYILKKRNIALIFAAFIIIFGVVCYATLPKQLYPVFPMPMAIVTAVYPGASAEDMEVLVTEKIEDVLMQAEGFDSCESYSTESVSITEMYFDIGMSAGALEKSKSDLRFKVEALKGSVLPQGLTYLNYNTDVGTTEGLFLAFTGDGISKNELFQRADELKTQLQNMPGVKRVSIGGKPEEEIRITVQTDKLNLMKLSLSELGSIIGYQNSLIPTGEIEFEEDIIKVNSSGAFESIDEIEDLIIDIDKNTGAVTCLKDIASVDKVQNRDSKRYDYNGKAAILLSLSYSEGIDVVSAGGEILKQVDKFKSNLPAGIEVHKVVDLSSDVNKSISEFTFSVIQAVVIVLAVIILGMNFRNGGIVAVAIPVSIMAPFLVMKVFGIDIQFMSLAALIIALGMLVDNAIVVSDAVQVRIDAGEDRLSACINGTREVNLPVLASVLTTVAIFIMIYFLPGTMFSFSNSLPTIIIVSLMVSYFVSITITPIMCYLLMKKSPQNKAKYLKLFDKLENLVNKVLQRALKHKIRTIIISVVILLVSVSVFAFINVEFMPKSDKKLIDISIAASTDTDIRKTEEVVKKVLETVSEQPEVVYYLSATGGTLPKYDFCFLPSVDRIGKGNIVLGIDLSKGKRFKNNERFTEFLQNELNMVTEGCSVTVKELDVVPKSSAPIQLKIIGDNFDELNKASEIIETQLEQTEGIRTLFSDRQLKTSQYYVDIDNTSLNTYGLTKAELLSEVNIALMGRNITQFRSDTQEYPVVLKGDIDSTEDLRNLMIKSNITGSKHQTRQMSHVTLKDNYSLISRYNGNRVVKVAAYPKVGYAPIKLQKQLEKKLEATELGNVELVYEGDAEQMELSVNGLIIGSIAGIAGIFIVLYFQFYSLKKVLITLCAIPFALVGASFGLFILNPGFNLFTILGILSLFGVVVNNSIVLVDYIESERAAGVPLTEACKSAVKRRFRPIYLSTVTTVLGMIPLAFGKNLLFTGLATAFMCGAAVCMFFTLILIPVIYDLQSGRKQKHKC